MQENNLYLRFPCYLYFLFYEKAQVRGVDLLNRSNTAGLAAIRQQLGGEIPLLRCRKPDFTRLEIRPTLQVRKGGGTLEAIFPSFLVYQIKDDENHSEDRDWPSSGRGVCVRL